MVVLDTELMPLLKVKEFFAAVQHLPDDKHVSIRAEEKDGKVTITLSVGNDHTCLAATAKKQPKPEKAFSASPIAFV